jgi:peptidyl-dipeptidase Dcp
LDRRTFLAASGAVVSGSPSSSAQTPSQNPFLQKWTTPYELPPFDQIKPAHFVPAFREGMKQELAEVEAIASAQEPATFVNTIEKLERSGELLTRVQGVFYNLTASETNKELQGAQREIAPLMAKHNSDINMNAPLFQRVKTVYDARKSSNLTPEQDRLTERYYKRLVRAGAQLGPDEKNRLANIEQKLASLTTKFQQNLLADTAAYELVLEKESDLAGLAPSLRASAAEAAKERGKPGKWVITLQRSSIEPFLQYSSRRDLREQAFKAWAARGDNENEFDNKALIREIVLLRMEKAQLLGYKTFADYVLDDSMAKTPKAAQKLLDDVWKPAVTTAHQEADLLSEAMKKDRIEGPLQPWDWRYYAEKVRLAKYDLDEEQVKPYFTLDKMIEAVIWVANQLFGVTFTERTDLPKYNPDLRTWEVKNAGGKLIGIFYGDYYARPSKQSGAWMNSFRKQQKLAGVTPVVSNNLNFNKPPAGQQALLSYDDAETLFHEFGHALHGLLSNVTYPSLAGTSVPRDFVELPSQIYEHWLAQKEVLGKFAVHYQTGKPMPQELLDKIQKARNFNQGFSTVEYLASAMVDMKWHLMDKAATIDVREMEGAWLKEIGMPREIIMRHRSSHFSHLFSSSTGYAAGYYSYMWSEVLDTDGFEAFQEKGSAFDPKVAQALYQYIYSTGGTAEPMDLYKSFRGRDPNSDALMRHRGFAPEKN